jgi:hypothetical protein
MPYGGTETLALDLAEVAGCASEQRPSRQHLRQQLVLDQADQQVFGWRHGGDCVDEPK